MKRQNLIVDLHLRERLTPMMHQLKMMRDEILSGCDADMAEWDPDWDRLQIALKRTIKELRRMLAPAEARKTELASATASLRDCGGLDDTLDRVILALTDNPDWDYGHRFLDDGWDESEGRYNSEKPRKPRRAA